MNLNLALNEGQSEFDFRLRQFDFENLMNNIFNLHFFNKPNFFNICNCSPFHENAELFPQRNAMYTFI